MCPRYPLGRCQSNLMMTDVNAVAGRRGLWTSRQDVTTVIAVCYCGHDSSVLRLLGAYARLPSHHEAYSSSMTAAQTQPLS